MLIFLPLLLLACTSGPKDDTAPTDTGTSETADTSDTGEPVDTTETTDTSDTSTDTSDTEDTADTSDTAEDPLALVTAKVGTYNGAWEMFGLDAADAPVSAMTWTDIAVASNPTLEADRA